MNLLAETIKNVPELDSNMMEQARTHVNSLIKPPSSLGKLEEIAIQLAGISGELYPNIDQKTIITMAADHGVFAEGISSNPQEVTIAQTLHFAKGLPGVCAISRVSGAKVIPVDIGINSDLPADSGVISRKIKYGTDNMAIGPAMTRNEAIRSIEVGIEMANHAVQTGTNLLGVGEMGIGNTTASTAILAVLGDCDPTDITGWGAGIGEGGVAHKISVIQKAIDVNQPTRTDAIDVLSKVGGLEIGGMAGVMLGAAANRVPIVIDGYISSVAALIAATIEPKAKAYFIPSHKTTEPGGRLTSELLGLEPMLDMNMCLGEGSGAALAFPILDAAVSMITNMPTFEDVGMNI